MTPACFNYLWIMIAWRVRTSNKRSATSTRPSYSCLTLSKPRQICSLSRGSGSQCSGHGLSLEAVAALWLQGSGRMEVLSIPAVHSDSLGAVIIGLGLLSGGGVIDAAGIRPSFTQ